MPDRLNDLRRGFRRIALATVGMFALGIAVAVFAYVTNGHRAREGQQAKQALCALRYDLKVRVAASEAFLREHPAGIPGIPVSVIRNGIVNQRHTLKALDNLRCPEVAS